MVRENILYPFLPRSRQPGHDERAAAARDDDTRKIYLRLEEKRAILEDRLIILSKESRRNRAKFYGPNLRRIPRSPDRTFAVLLVAELGWAQAMQAGGE
jgi:hypothetical protein